MKKIIIKSTNSKNSISIKISNSNNNTSIKKDKTWPAEQPVQAMQIIVNKGFHKNLIHNITITLKNNYNIEILIKYSNKIQLNKKNNINKLS